MNIQATKALIVFGVAGLLYFLTRPGSLRKPGKETSAEKVKENAAIVGKAYLAAMQAGETASRLEELNRESEKRYSLRAYTKPGEKSIYVMDTKGKDILKVY